MIVLGIETTCDETAAAVVERPQAGPGNILSNVVLSQVNDPELHRDVISLNMIRDLTITGGSVSSIDGMSTTDTPGHSVAAASASCTPRPLLMITARSPSRSTPPLPNSKT